MPKRPRKRRFWRIFLVTSLLVFGFVFLTNWLVLNSSGGRIYEDVNQVPERPVAIVLGTSPRIHGRLNLYFESRMRAATDLYRAGKVRKILVSGDNGSRGYDEPNAMRKALISRGVPAEDIVMDYAGFRTLDTMARARKVFGLQRVAVVTDDFHLPRALYLAQAYDLDAVGYPTASLPMEVSPRTHIREIGARTLVWMDVHLLNRQPKYLGHRETSLVGFAR